jgi:phage-related protein
VTAAQKQIETGTAAMASKLKSAGASMTSVGKKFSMGVTAPIVAGGVLAVKAFMDANAIVKTTLTTWKKDADAAALSFKGMRDWSTQFGDSIGQDDEAILQLSGKIENAVNLTKLFGKGGAQAGLEQLTKGVLDMSAATGKSQTMVQKLFNSIANDPKSALGTLLKLGVITSKQKDAYTKMADAGHTAQVSQLLLNAATDKYGGAAAKSATPVAKLKAQFDNLTEDIGKQLMPVVKQVIGWAQDAIKWFGNLSPATQGLIVKIALFAAAIGPVLIVVGKLTSAIGSVIGIVGKLSAVLSANPWVLIIAATILLVIIIVKNWSTIKAFLLKVWHAIQAAWMAVWNKIKVVVVPVINFLKKAVGLYIKFIILELHILAAVWKVIWNALKSVFSTVWNAITTIIKVEWAIWKGIFNTVKTVIVGIWHTIHDVAVSTWHGISGVITGVWNTISGVVRGGANVIIDALNSIIGGINTVISGFNHLPGPDLPTVPTIPRLARGGTIMQSGYAIVGERGPELVSLSRGARVEPLGAGGRQALVVVLDRTRFGRQRELAYLTAGR